MEFLKIYPWCKLRCWMWCSHGGGSHQEALQHLCQSQTAPQKIYNRSMRSVVTSKLGFNQSHVKPLVASPAQTMLNTMMMAQLMEQTFMNSMGVFSQSPFQTPGGLLLIASFGIVLLLTLGGGMMLLRRRKPKQRVVILPRRRRRGDS
eukprot:Blabericola_migrator_1__4725@NODE_2493_length_2686_cov_49_576556_g1563_i0_p3_GENE_NODE_2493_length_2686_cov_49_576556_g1563_i0NODE_2493_length_2686_cov_49_576556_g1563_i0_p3_ORF_typecomplete_len148_score17_74LPG_synthase_TM/PF03706_13/0_026_NODE_2493_length_2686_cov_49_576556_g1563_i08141257